jgi:asparagine synthase (glutamine-hydrolysing)
MCGIFGIAARNTRIPEGLLDRGTQSLAHRGPDDSGTIVVRDAENEIGLGNRRLAIIDLSPLGHQPMQDPETGNWIVYNGEIYNFRQVRAELAAGGIRFATQCDTEVLLKAYAHWGESCLTRLRGMFALAVWDARQHLLFLARDPMGIKPLYYTQTGNYFVFASEVRSLLGTGLLARRLHAAGLRNYLTFGSAYDPLTPVEGVQALPAGHWLHWKDGTLRRSCYWDLLDSPSSNGSAVLSAKNATDASARLQPLLEESVRMQLVSDVPVGLFLSGGVDSSALVSIVSAEGVRPSTFSIVFRESEFSEAEHSRAIAQAFHTDHHEIEVSQSDVLSAIPDALGAMDLPTMDGVNTFFVSRETRKAGVKVALSGLGGDEVFAGYSSFRTIPRFESAIRKWGRVPELGRNGIAFVFSAIAPESDQNRKLALLMLNHPEVLHPYFVSRMLFTPEQQRRLLLNSDHAVLETALASLRDILDRTRYLDPINRVSYLESRCYMLNTLLRDSDFMSMSQGLELRVPLIDQQLAKTVMALPGKWKLNGTPKNLLVNALSRPLPDSVVHRRKCGFTLPLEDWMRRELRAEIEPVLQATRIDNGPLGGMLRGQAVHNIWQSFRRRKVSWSRPWSLYVLQRWCEKHL